MISTIVDGADSSKRSQYITDLYSSHPNHLHLAPDPTSIGIAQIKSLVSTLSLTTPLPRLVWIEEAQLLTLDASGALLKILEEPPSNTTLYLTCPNASALLPTIRSRCQTHTLPTTTSTSSPITNLTDLKPLFGLSAGDRISHLADFPSDKSELLEYFNQLAKEINSTIKQTKSEAGLQLLSKLGELTLTTHSALKGNVNQNLALSHFLLHLPKVK